jgi:DinB family protein
MVTSGLDESLREMEQMPDLIAEQARALPADRWEAPVWGGEGGWNRRQLLAHIATINLRHLTRVRLGAGMNDPSGMTAANLPPVDDFNAAEVAKLEGKTVPELLEMLRSNRAELMRLVRSLTPEQKRAFRMPRGNESLTIEEWAPFVTNHDKTHLAEIMG